MCKQFDSLRFEIKYLKDIPYREKSVSAWAGWTFPFRKKQNIYIFLLIVGCVFVCSTYSMLFNICLFEKKTQTHILHAFYNFVFQKTCSLCMCTFIFCRSTTFPSIGHCHGCPTEDGLKTISSNCPVHPWTQYSCIESTDQHTT